MRACATFSRLSLTAVPVLHKRLTEFPRNKVSYAWIILIQWLSEYSKTETKRFQTSVMKNYFLIQFQFQFIDSMPQLNDRMTQQICRQWKRTKRHRSALTIALILYCFYHSLVNKDFHYNGIHRIEPLLHLALIFILNLLNVCYYVTWA